MDCPAPSTLIAIAALVVASSGSAVAVRAALISGDQIAPNAIGTRHLGGGAVTKAKLSPGLLQLINRAGDAGAVGPQGDRGAKGDPGVKGDTGPAGPRGDGASNPPVRVQYIGKGYPLTPQTSLGGPRRADCPAGTQVVGGGFSFASNVPGGGPPAGPFYGEFDVGDSSPSPAAPDQPSGWSVSVFVHVPLTLVVHAVCLGQ